jgi:hypothetical protein
MDGRPYLRGYIDGDHHLVAFLTHPDIRGPVFTSSTPRDRRAGLNLRAMLRRACGRHTVEPGHLMKPWRKARGRRPVTDEPFPLPTFDLGELLVELPPLPGFELAPVDEIVKWHAPRPNRRQNP